MDIRRLAKEKRRSFGKVVAGIVLLVIAIPVFLDYKVFPVINSEIGPHQIGSWLALLFSFIGFILIIVGMGEMDI
ncbi:TVG0368277 [Thermoplasma volcanium GSS1]|uniref:TVG0368277 protein n=1 Tax=Thermoplasma volcanium (strain ATCC 51530 / DSM 4299 / JCM 9571 / NBRC 15438 / GSS1) TaxID=273116 RepID=Q97BS5_THEVO|nr:hypothetical protein [Thermoplasma volcanium]BAB59522.1 TVG0368277 [Thermoplasma volcanium GSS1]